MLPELKITQLRHFVWVAELKSFHAAAKRASRTQPAISLSIRDLESKLGESLFEKRSSKVAMAILTPFGEEFISRAKDLIAHHDRVAEDIILLAEHKTGHLRIASVPSVASGVLPDLLLQFMQGTPKLNLSFYDDNSTAILELVEKQRVDFGICHLIDQDNHRDKVFTPIWEDQIGVVCRSDHSLASHKSLEWEQLRDYRLIKNGTSPLLENSEAHSLIEQSQVEVSNMISLTAMLEAGFGLTTLPWYAFPKQNNALKFIPLTSPLVKRVLGIVQLSDMSLSPAAQAFKDFILNHVGEKEVKNKTRSVQ